MKLIVSIIFEIGQVHRESQENLDHKEHKEQTGTLGVLCTHAGEEVIVRILPGPPCCIQVILRW
jgi:hypothetical protein